MSVHSRAELPDHDDLPRPRCGALARHGRCRTSRILASLLCPWVDDTVTTPSRGRMSRRSSPARDGAQGGQLVELPPAPGPHALTSTPAWRSAATAGSSEPANTATTPPTRAARRPLDLGDPSRKWPERQRVRDAGAPVMLVTRDARQASSAIRRARCGCKWKRPARMRAHIKIATS